MIRRGVDANAGALYFPPLELGYEAALVGVETFLRAANTAWLVLVHAELYAAACSAAQFQSFAQHVVHATELMQLPRRLGDVAVDQEEMFAALFRDAFGNGGTKQLAPHLVLQLVAAWQQLQRSGVLQARGIEKHLVVNESENQAFAAAVQNSMTAPGLRSCALAGCGAREAHPAHFKSCAACRTVAYCSKEHQVEAWPAHKKACKAARKAAAAAAEDGAGPSGA